MEYEIRCDETDDICNDDMLIDPLWSTDESHGLLLVEPKTWDAQYHDPEFKQVASEQSTLVADPWIHRMPHSPIDFLGAMVEDSEEQQHGQNTEPGNMIDSYREMQDMQTTSAVMSFPRQRDDRSHVVSCIQDVFANINRSLLERTSPEIMVRNRAQKYRTKALWFNKQYGTNDFRGLSFPGKTVEESWRFSTTMPR